MIDVQDESVANRKKVMISNATQPLIEVYKEKQKYAIAQEIQELKKNNI